MVARLRERYDNEVIVSLTEQFGYINPMQLPRLSKIVVNMGIGEAATNAKILDGAMSDLSRITGQQPNVRLSRKAISNFKLRAGLPVGCAVTLRRERMYEFLDRLLTVAIPRIRDFRGVKSRAFDGRGNYSLGLTEQTIFPEIDLDSIDQTRGMDVVIVTTANTDEEALALLRGLGMPFEQVAQTED